MTRFTANTLDLSRLNPAALFPVISFENIRAARLADLKARLVAADYEYDVESLETDPGVYLQETGAYRELLARQSIQDAQKSVLLAFAYGPFLDRLGDQMDTARQPAPGVAAPRPYAQNPEDWETDERYRGRIQLAPEKFARAGTPSGYIYHALEASPQVKDVGVTVLDRGTPDVRVELTILSYEGIGVPSSDTIMKVRKAVTADNVKLMTDDVVVRPAVGVPYAVVGTLYLQDGPDPTVVKQVSTASVVAMGKRYHRLGGGVPSSAIVSSAQVASVDAVIITSPPSGVVTQRFEFAYLTGVALDTMVLKTSLLPQ